MLSIKNLEAGINGKMILKGINLEIKAGEIHAIMGPNGSGKSTLAAVLAGRDFIETVRGTATYMEMIFCRWLRGSFEGRNFSRVSVSC